MLANVFSSRSKLLLIAGLLGLAVAVLLYLVPKNRILMRPVLWVSKYRRITKYVIAQAKTETGDFSSSFYNDLHNCFGMKGAVKRRQLGTKGTRFEADGGNALQKYRSDIQSLRDLFLYFDYVKFPTSVSGTEQYVSELKRRGYFTTTETHYLSLMKSHLPNKA